MEPTPPGTVDCTSELTVRMATYCLSKVSNCVCCVACDENVASEGCGGGGDSEEACRRRLVRTVLGDSEDNDVDDRAVWEVLDVSLPSSSPQSHTWAKAKVVSAL